MNMIPLHSTIRFRCHWIVKASFVTTLIVFLICGRLSAQNELNVIQGNWLQYTDASNALYHHLSSEAIDLLKKREDAVLEINTLDEWQQRQEFVKETLLDI